MTLLVNCTRLVHVSASRHFETNALFLFFPFVSLGLKRVRNKKRFIHATEMSRHRIPSTLTAQTWSFWWENTPPLIAQSDYRLSNITIFSLKSTNRGRQAILANTTMLYVSLLGLVSNLFSAFYLHDVSEFIFNRFSVDSKHRLLACS